MRTKKLIPVLNTQSDYAIILFVHTSHCNILFFSGHIITENIAILVNSKKQTFKF